MTTLTDTQVITASGGLVELGYSQITSAVSITNGTYGTGTEVIAPLTVVCDGGPILVEFFSQNVYLYTPPVIGDVVDVALWQDGAEHTRYWGRRQADAAQPTGGAMSLKYRVTPSAGTHTFGVKAVNTAGVTRPGGVNAGAGGASVAPAFLRVSKIVQATQWPAVTTGTIICTSSTRPSAPFEGQEIYETDTDLEQRWTGSAWVVSGSTGTSFLSASSTTTVAAASTITYTQASITLTPGVWEVKSAMTLINGTTTDSAAVAIYNQTAAAVVSGSYGTPGYTSTSWAAALQSIPTKMTVASNTQVCPYGNRNGGSTIAPASGVGAPVGLITARRLYGG